MADEAFEMVPITPIRKLEREIKRLKSQMQSNESPSLVTQVVEILRMNQAIVDQLSVRQGELLTKLSETNAKLGRLSDSLEKLLEELVATAEEGDAYAEERVSVSSSGRVDKLDKIVEQNAALINSLTVLTKELDKLGRKS